MFAQFFLVLVLLDPRTGDMHKYMMDRESFPLADCQDMEYYFKDNPVRSYDDHSPWVVVATSCVRKYGI